MDIDITLHQVIGYVGLILLILAYVFYGLLHKEKLFIITNILATFALTIYAILNKDLIFSLVNGFILLMLFNKYINYLQKEVLDGSN